MTKRKRRAFTEEFKAETVRLVPEGGKSTAEIARDMDLTESAVRSWVRQANIDDGRGTRGDLIKAEREELHRLRRENKPLQMECEIPKINGSLLRQGKSMRYRFIAADRAHYRR